MKELTENYFKLETIDAFISWFSVNGNNLLEKEKEQIIQGHFAGWSDAYDYLKSDSNDRARQAEEYYNETYNQKP